MKGTQQEPLHTYTKNNHTSALKWIYLQLGVDNRTRIFCSRLGKGESCRAIEATVRLHKGAADKLVGITLFSCGFTSIFSAWSLRDSLSRSRYCRQFNEHFKIETQNKSKKTKQNKNQVHFVFQPFAHQNAGLRWANWGKIAAYETRCKPQKNWNVKKRTFFFNNIFHYKLLCTTQLCYQVLNASDVSIYFDNY